MSSIPDVLPASIPRPLRLGTRGSLLARTQSQLVANVLESSYPGLVVEMMIVKTSGDRITDQPLHAFGGKGLFTKELEQALLAGEIDFAVHSFKDVPVTMPLVPTEDLVIAATPVREDARDVLVSTTARTLEDLAPGARVGTGSLRRRCQILSSRPDVLVEPVRGNIDTRLRKLHEGAFDAIVLAYAGARRTGLFDAADMAVLDAAAMLPAPGQGALALQCRRNDDRTRTLLESMNDTESALCVAAERGLVRLLNGDCHSPIAAYAEVIPAGAGADAPDAEPPSSRTIGAIRLYAAVGARDGDPPVIRSVRTAASADPDAVARLVLEDLQAQGVAELLR